MPLVGMLLTIDQTVTAPANVAHQSSWITRHQSVIRHISGNNRPSSYQGKSANGNIRQNNGAGTNSCAVFDVYFPDLPFYIAF